MFRQLFVPSGTGHGLPLSQAAQWRVWRCLPTLWAAMEGRIHAASAVSLLLAAGSMGFANEVPAKYVLDYPAAVHFCPPVAMYFQEVQRTMSRVGRRTFRHQPNGGYGLPVQLRVEGQHLIHLGADVGWYQVGAPVFAIADGVVRISEGPPQNENDENDEKRKIPPGAMAWGNLIAIEHRLGNDRYVTSVYGHLDTERLVKQGDIVTAGQQIGTLGAKRVNGGYNPHLHFGIRDGRMAEVGRKLLNIQFTDRLVPLVIQDVDENVITLRGAEDFPAPFPLTINGETFAIEEQEGSAVIDARLLWHFTPSEFAIIGYGLSAESWHDPTSFLREQRADSAPAAFQLSEEHNRRRDRGR